jgi:hypothetical protein
LLPLLQQSFKIHQVGVGVDAQDFLGIADGDMGDLVLFSHCKRHHIGEVLFSLIIVTPDTP